MGRGDPVASPKSGNCGVITGLAIAQAGATLMARVVGNQGTPINSATLAAVAYTVQDLTALTNVCGNSPLAIAGTIFDTLQQSDPRWTKDSAQQPGPDGLYGYNFLTTLPARLFAAVNPNTDVNQITGQVTPHQYQVQVTYTPQAGEVFLGLWKFTALPTW